VTISAEPGAIVTVIDKVGARKNLDLRTLEGAHVSSTDTISDPIAIINWIEETGQIVTAQLVGIKGENFEFALQRVKTPN
jgi:hypothetical protein